jgi:hypothetical protein
MKHGLVWLILGASSLAAADGNSTIPGWHRGEGNPPDNHYVLSIDRSDAYNGTSSAVLASQQEFPDDTGSIVQFVIADRYRGKRVRFSAALKTADVRSWATMWIRADGTDDTGRRIVKAESIQSPEQRLHGDTSWRRYSLVLDIPEDTTSLAYGAEVHGVGKLWVDSVQLELVSQDVPVTLKIKPSDTHFPAPQHRVLPAPANLDFEE